MPYIIISSDFLHDGPTRVGDAESDPLLMHQLGARDRGSAGSADFLCDCPPRVVLNKLDRMGYNKMNGFIGNSEEGYCWTLQKE